MIAAECVEQAKLHAPLIYSTHKALGYTLAGAVARRQIVSTRVGAKLPRHDVLLK